MFLAEFGIGTFFFKDWSEGDLALEDVLLNFAGFSQLIYNTSKRNPQPLLVHGSVVVLIFV